MTDEDREDRQAGAAIVALTRRLAQLGDIAVAVSGGIDSLTLANVAFAAQPDRVEMFHAVSAAVPLEATQRVERCAREGGWRLRIIDAGEFEREHYVSNPVDRCYYCKQSLYGTIARATTARVLSGTNADDLSDYRPGLVAASEHDVLHPFVELGIDKAMVRRIARHLGMGDLAVLPASPCLSSRVETGIAIDAATLRLIEAAERLVRARVDARAVRCRVRAAGVVIELDPQARASLTDSQRDSLTGEVEALFAGKQAGPPTFAPYRTGSAFLVRHG
jgi:pyridinium-3,5-biscarboxylic acid mononucleotide sulfurtransferase